MELTVDGHVVQVPAGTTLLMAARSAGVEVPTLCHDDRLEPAGSCRVCLVSADSDVVAACTTPAVAGMEVTTTDPTVRATVRGVVQLLAHRLPERALSLPTELTDVCAGLGVDTSAFAGSGPRRVVDETHPYFTYDPNLCIACGRCVRVCEEVQGTFALTLAGRGADTVAAPGRGDAWVDSSCVSCGTCVDSCPSGALRERGSPDPTSTVLTTCGYCGVGCTLDVHTAHGRVVAMTPVPTAPVNRGHACVKGRFAHGFAHAADRLTTPLLRRDGRLEPVSWDEALAFIAAEVTRIRSVHGPDAIAGISSARATNEENYLMQKLMRTVIGTNNVDNCSRICHAPSAAGLSAAFGLAGGTNPLEDVDTADAILVAGSNATEAHPVVGSRIVEATLRGARLIVADPRRTELARLADVHLQLRPGSNVALFNGMARALLDHGWVDRDFVDARADGMAALEQVLADYPTSRAAAICGVAEARLLEAAEILGRAERPAVFYGLGVTEHAHGTDGVRTLANLAILRGAVGTEHGGGVNPLRGQNNVQGASDMGSLPDLLPGYQPVADPAVRAAFESAWHTPLPSRPGLRIPDMLDGAVAGRVRALYVMGEDIAQTDPNTAHVRAALDRCEVVIVQDPFLSRTAELADVVLPGATFLEKDGTFVNFDRRFQRVRPALRPPGTARTDFDTLRAVAAALGSPLGPATPAEALAECARLAPMFGGLSHERLDSEGALHWPCRSADDPGQPRLYSTRFETASGRAQLAALPWLPPAEEPDPDYPFTLITGRRLAHYNAGTMTRRTADLDLDPTDLLDLHPEDAQRLGVADGDVVEVESRRGAVRVRSRLTTDVSVGQTFLSFHFPDVGTNILTSSHVDEVTSCPEYKVTAVRVRPTGSHLANSEPRTGTRP